MDKIQKIAVTAFITHKNKVLLVRRSQKEGFLPGYYEMPGGKTEFGESTEDALVREIKEEINLNIKIIKPYSTFSYTSSNNTRHTIDIQFFSKLKDDIKNIKLSQEHDHYIFANKEDIDKMQMTDEMKAVVLRGFENINLNS